MGRGDRIHGAAIDQILVDLAQRDAQNVADAEVWPPVAGPTPTQIRLQTHVQRLALQLQNEAEDLVYSYPDERRRPPAIDARLDDIDRRLDQLVAAEATFNAAIGKASSVSREQYLRALMRAAGQQDVIVEADRRLAYKEWLAEFEEGRSDAFKSDFNYARLQEANYLATIVGFKPDPMGRFPLIDVYVGYTSVYLTLSGASRGDNPVMLAFVWFADPFESYEGNKYVRQHAHPGARMLRQGWGAAAYMATAWSVYFRGVAYGSGSPSGGYNRTDLADEVWQSLVDHGSAVETFIGKERTNFLPYSALVDSGVLLWTNWTPNRSDHLSQSTPFDMDWRWNGKKRARIERRPPVMPQAHELDVFAGISKLSELNAARLARSYHGDSPLLVVHVANKLIESGYSELAQQYLLRPDVAQIAGRHPRYLELLGQRRLPGISGLAGIADVEALHQAAARGKVVVDWSKENPLDLPGMSAAMKAEVERAPSF